MIKQGVWLRKVWVKKAHVSQKIVLYFKGVIVNTEDYNQWSRSVTPQKYPIIFIIRIIIYFGYNWANLGIFLGIIR